MAFVLAGCVAGGGVALGTSEPHVALSGRWTLAAPNAPPCGVEFHDTQTGQSGQVTPDGGCPGNLYMSRRWTLADGTLTIRTENDDALAQLDSRGAHFEGKAADGMPLILSRKPAR